MADVVWGELGVVYDLFLAMMRSREGVTNTNRQGHQSWAVIGVTACKKDQHAHIGIHHIALWRKFGNSGSTSFNVICSSGICIGSTLLEYV